MLNERKRDKGEGRDDVSDACDVGIVVAKGTTVRPKHKDTPVQKQEWCVGMDDNRNMPKIHGSLDQFWFYGSVLFAGSYLRVLLSSCPPFALIALAYFCVLGLVGLV